MTVSVIVVSVYKTLIYSVIYVRFVSYFVGFVVIAAAAATAGGVVYFPSFSSECDSA